MGIQRHPGHLFAGLPQAANRGSPVLGQDNQHVYQELLAVSDAQSDECRRTQLLAQGYVDASGERL